MLSWCFDSYARGSHVKDCNHTRSYRPPELRAVYLGVHLEGEFVRLEAMVQGFYLSVPHAWVQMFMPSKNPEVNRGVASNDTVRYLFEVSSIGRRRASITMCLNQRSI